MLGTATMLRVITLITITNYSNEILVVPLMTLQIPRPPLILPQGYAMRLLRELGLAPLSGRDRVH